MKKKLKFLLKAKENKAVNFYNLNLVKKFFEQIKIYVEVTQHKRENHLLAEEFYKLKFNTKKKLAFLKLLN